MKPSPSSGSIDLYPTCPICMSKYDERDCRPKVIPCGHTVCLACLESHLTITLQGNPFTCPICRKMPTMPKSGLQGFPDNEALKELLQRTAEEDTAVEQTSPRCEDHPGQEIEIICVLCKDTKCNECLKQDAINRSTSIAHASLCLDANNNDKAVSGGHRFENYSAWSAEQQAKLDRRNTYITLLLNEVAGNTAHMNRQLEQDMRAQEEAVTRVRDSMVQQVETWADDSLKEIRARYYENKEDLSSNHYKWVDQNNELLAMTDSLLNYTVGSLSLIDKVHEQQNQLIRELTAYQVPRKNTLGVIEKVKLKFPSLLQERELDISVAENESLENSEQVKPSPSARPRGALSGLSLTLLHCQHYHGQVAVSPSGDKVLLADEKIQALTTLRLHGETLFPLNNTMSAKLSLRPASIRRLLVAGGGGGHVIVHSAAGAGGDKPHTAVYTRDLHRVGRVTGLSAGQYGAVQAAGRGLLYFREEKSEILTTRWKITMRPLNNLAKSQVLMSGSGREPCLMSVRASNGDVVILNKNENIVNIFNVQGQEVANLKLRHSAGSLAVDQDGHVWVSESGTRDLHVYTYASECVALLRTVSIAGYRDLDFKQVDTDESTQEIWCTEKYLYASVLRSSGAKYLKVFSISKSWHELS